MTNCNDSFSQAIPLQEEDSDGISCEKGDTTLLASNVHKRVTVRSSIDDIRPCACAKMKHANKSLYTSSCCSCRLLEICTVKQWLNAMTPVYVAL
jgi:hypothetical protein